MRIRLQTKIEKKKFKFADYCLLKLGLIAPCICFTYIFCFTPHKNFRKQKETFLPQLFHTFTKWLMVISLNFAENRRSPRSVSLRSTQHSLKRLDRNNSPIANNDTKAATSVGSSPTSTFDVRKRARFQRRRFRVGFLRRY